MSRDDRTVMDFDRTRVSAEGQLLFGKHKGKYIEDVARFAPGYLDWMLDEIYDLSDGEREDVEDALRGESPRKHLRPVSQLTLPTSTAAPPPRPAGPPALRVLPGGRSSAGASANEIAGVAPLPRPVATPSPGCGRAASGDVATSSVAGEGAASPTSPEKDPFDLPPTDSLLLPTATSIAPGWTWTDEQQVAIDELIAWAKGKGPRIVSLTGFAGSGKSTCLREIIQHAPLVHPAAMTGKAALRLRELTNRGTSTLHAVLYRPPEEQRGGELEFSHRRKPEMATLITDEASMITPQIYADLMEWAALGVRILLVGDPMQLPPILTKQEVEAYGEDFTVFEKVKGPTLTKVMRAAGAIPAAAAYLREHKKVQTESSGGYRFARIRDPLAQAVADYLHDPADHVLITWRNEIRLAANRAVRARLDRRAKLPERGEPVLIRQNQGAFLNGEIVVADYWSEGPTIGGEHGEEGLPTTWLHTTDGAEILTLPQGKSEWMDGFRPFIKDWVGWLIYCRDLDRPHPIPVPVTWGYALTCHAMQGSQARRVTTFLAPGDAASPNFRKPSRLPSGETIPMSVRFLYTALTRATTATTLYVPG